MFQLQNYTNNKFLENTISKWYYMIFWQVEIIFMQDQIVGIC